MRVVALLALAASLVALGTAAPASAGLGIACPNPISQVFLPWGDIAKYGLAPNGGFESGAGGWTLSGGAQVVAGNESFYVTDSGDDSSLSLPAGSSATSAPMCIGAFSGKMRFFTANAGAAGSRLRVQAIYGGGLGQVLGIFDVGYVSSGGDWQPSPEIRMWGGVLPLLTQWVKFRFTPADGSGSWQIDDVYLDPLMQC